MDGKQLLGLGIGSSLRSSSTVCWSTTIPCWRLSSDVHVLELVGHLINTGLLTIWRLGCTETWLSWLLTWLRLSSHSRCEELRSLGLLRLARESRLLRLLEAASSCSCVVTRLRLSSRSVHLCHLRSGVLTPLAMVLRCCWSSGRRWGACSSTEYWLRWDFPLSVAGRCV